MLQGSTQRHEGCIACSIILALASTIIVCVTGQHEFNSSRLAAQGWGLHYQGFTAYCDQAWASLL